MAKKPNYPEHEKMAAIKDSSQAIGGFLEWLSEQGIELAKFHEHTDECERGCLREENGDLESHRYTTEGILAQYFEIDLKKVEKEKVTMLAALREAHSKEETGA